ncbi:MAG: hypothetical protein V4736_15405 [Bdellovibrionota bacterium]
MKNGYDQHFKKAQQAAALNKKPAFSVNNMNTSMLRPKKKKKSGFSVKLVFLSVLGFSGALGGYLYVDQIEGFLKRFEIGFMGQAMAEDVKKPDAKPVDAAKAAEAAAKATEAAKEAEATSSGPDDHLQKLVDRQKELEAKEEELKKIEEELAVQKQELEKKLKDLEEVRGQISTVLNDRVQADSAKVDNLVQLYSNMRPQQAAKVFETLDEDLTVEVLGRMKKKNAAEIMNLMKADKAKVLSEKLAGYKRSPASVPSVPSTMNEEPTIEETAESQPAPEESVVEPVQKPSEKPVQKKAEAPSSEKRTT